MAPGTTSRLSRVVSSRFVLAGAVVAGLLMGYLVYHKAIRLHQGDQDVFFRAAWSIRQGGADLYEITDDHGWHYHYPPLFAILLVPLASPPSIVPIAEQHAILPPIARVMLLYAINLASLVLSVLLLAR